MLDDGVGRRATTAAALTATLGLAAASTSNSDDGEEHSQMTTKMKALPRIVSRKEWQAAHRGLLAKEKAATRARDALAARRRKQPMVEIEKGYVFEGPDGKASLLDLFEGRRQLILY